MVQQLNATKLMNVLKEPFQYLGPNLRMDFNLTKITEESLKYSGLWSQIKFNFQPVKVVETDNENYALIVTCLNVSETQVGFLRCLKNTPQLSQNENQTKRYEYFSILYRDTKCFASDERDAKMLNVLNDLGLRVGSVPSFLTFGNLREVEKIRYVRS